MDEGNNQSNGIKYSLKLFTESQPEEKPIKSQIPFHEYNEKQVNFIFIPDR